MKKGLIYQKYDLIGNSNIHSSTPSGKVKLNRFCTLQIMDGWDNIHEVDIPVTNEDMEILTQLDTSECEYPVSLQCYHITRIPQFDTSGAITLSNMFSSCANLIDVPVFNAESAERINYMFSGYNVDKLSDESLNNVMATCISAVNLAPNQIKTLQDVLGYPSDMEILNKCATLSNYQDFVNAGWTLY